MRGDEAKTDFMGHDAKMVRFTIRKARGACQLIQVMGREIGGFVE